jgi:acetate---CoA ligase (ADP-forming)
MGAFDGLFHPRGVAIVGASRDLDRGGGQPVKALLAYGYKGNVYPVNPKYDEIGGVRCYRSIRDISGPCDVAVIALPADAAIAALRECAQAGIRYAVIYGGGFREAGAEGLARERTLLDVAQAGGIRLIGPNCLGLVNITDRVYAAFGSMMREPLLAAGSVSMVYQSGGFGQSLALRVAATGAGFRFLVASGNETDITTPELIDYFLDDGQTKIVVSYVEGVRDGRALMAAGRKAAALGKPILLWKAGRRAQGLRAAASHTASMTGQYDIYRAALAQSGIIEVRDMEEVADLVSVFATDKLPAGPRVGLLGGSGGSAIVFADTCDEEGLEIPPLSAPEVADSISNPADFAAGFLNDATAPKFAAGVNRMLADDHIDQICIMLATVQGRQALNGARILAEASRHTSKPIMVFSSVPRNTMQDALKVFAEARIPVLPSPTRVAHAARVTASYAAMCRRIQADTPAEHFDDPGQLKDVRRSVLNEVESKALLKQHGITVTRDVIVPKGSAIPLASITYPAVVKVISSDLPHKSDVGGVRLGITNATDLADAVRTLPQHVARSAPAASIDGVMISEMVEDGIEMVVGVIHDDVFGPTVLLGLGGTLTEVRRDVSYRVAPFGVATAHAMINELRGRAILDGVRGRLPGDIDALAEVISRVSDMAWMLRGRIAELDINPLFVRPAGHGVIAGDALAVMAG